MNKLFDHMHLLPGHGLVRRHGAGEPWGEMWAAPGSRLGGRKVFFTRAEATFQKGKSHYAVVLLDNCKAID